MKSIGVLLLMLTCFLCTCQQQTKPAITNENNTTKLSSSQIITTKVARRQLSIYLPANYNSEKQYKVIYFHDGQDLFKKDLWALQSVLDDLIADDVIAPLIIVGIHSTRNRSSDLVPYEDNFINTTWGAYRPRAAQFSDLIQNSIVPYIEKNYSISKVTQDQALFGASFGGLHAIWEASQHPDRWGMVAGFSPSAWVANYALMNTVKQSDWQQTKLWFDIGTGEWEYYVPLIELLIDKGLSYGEELFYLEIPNGKHFPKDWRERIMYPLIAFAGKQEYSVKSMKVAIEFIPSQSSNRIFQRINPIITLTNEMQYSAADQATYELLNPDAGELKKDGRFRFTGEEPLRIKVIFRGLEEEVVVKKENDE